MDHFQKALVITRNLCDNSPELEMLRHKEALIRRDKENAVKLLEAMMARLNANTVVSITSGKKVRV